MVFKIYSSDSLLNANKLSPKEKNFHLSREALKSCLREYRPDGQWEKSKSLEIVNYHYLLADDQLRVSLSHTGQVGAALLCHCNEASSVGIDIEFAHRHISSGASRFFKNPKDKWDYQKKGEILWAWSLKEAAFKALSPLINYNEKRPLLLKHIWIYADEFGLGLCDEPIGKLQKKHDQTLSLNIALAFVEDNQKIDSKMMHEKDKDDRIYP